uniref:LEM domain-containing protein n=1 Tax=Salmo trutta TaxID=8032 RepID=A0A673ZEC9_SALTR
MILPWQQVWSAPGHYELNPKRNAGNHGNVAESSNSRGGAPGAVAPIACYSWEQVTDVLMEMFPETEPTRTGIAATRQRPIKGAAGRPVQFKYPDLPASPMTLQRQALERRLVPLFVQILVFLILTCLFYLIYAAMEHSSDHPFVALLDNLSMGTETEGLSLQADPLNSSVHPL